VVKAEFDLRGLKSVEERATFVHAILGNHDQVSYDRPFLWMSTDDPEWKGASPEPERKVSVRFPLVFI
jgi:hypothetical protein